MIMEWVFLILYKILKRIPNKKPHSWGFLFVGGLVDNTDTHSNAIFLMRLLPFHSFHDYQLLKQFQ